MRVSPSFALLGLLLLLGCPKPAVIQSTEREPFDGDAALSVSVRVIVPGDGGERLLSVREPLHHGARLALLVRTNQTAFVNVSQQSSSGKADVLFPDAIANQKITGKCALRIPEHGWFYLAGSPGSENVNVVASLMPLAQADPRLCHALRMSCLLGPTKLNNSPCASLLSGRRRQSQLVQSAQDEGSGVASVAVTLQHLP